MSRSSLLFAGLVLSLTLSAQVAVTPWGTAVTPGVAVPGTPVSPPVVYAPILRLGEGPTQPAEANAGSSSSVGIGLQPGLQYQTQPGVASQAPANTQTQPFNFGVARFDINEFGGASADSSRSLGEIARELKQSQQSQNAKSFTNADIQKMDQQTSGGISGAISNTRNDGWPANNGVIAPGGTANAPHSVGAPAQTQEPGQKSPFSPRSENDASGVSPHPQPYEIAQNNSANDGLAQQGPANSAASTNTSSTAESHSEDGNLPKTASRLPLFGVLGLFSISMGLFVRYQRAKAAR